MSPTETPARGAGASKDRGGAGPLRAHLAHRCRQQSRETEPRVLPSKEKHLYPTPTPGLIKKKVAAKILGTLLKGNYYRLLLSFHCFKEHFNKKM